MLLTVLLRAWMTRPSPAQWYQAPGVVLISSGSQDTSGTAAAAASLLVKFIIKCSSDSTQAN